MKRSTFGVDIFVCERNWLHGLPYPEAILGLNAVTKRYQARTNEIAIGSNVGDHLVPAIKTAKEAET